MRRIEKKGVFTDRYVETMYDKGCYHNVSGRTMSRFMACFVGIAISAIAVIGTIAILV